MTFSMLRPSDWQTQPWKNGGGITHELRRMDDEKGMCWRLSIAEVASAGPFSTFEGVDRVILMLEGRGFRLVFPNRDHHEISEIARPFSFLGETPIECALLDGPVLDFNVMTRRSDYRAEVRAIQLSEEPERLIPASLPFFIFVVKGELKVTCKGRDQKINRHHLLQVREKDETVLAQATEPGSCILVICLRQV